MGPNDGAASGQPSAEVMNPIDHPHGGGEGKTAAAKAPVSPWGTPTKGYKTRRNKRTSGMIIVDRRKRKG